MTRENRCPECWGEKGEHVFNCSRFYDPRPAHPAAASCDEACREEGKWSGYCAGDGDPVAATSTELTT